MIDEKERIEALEEDLEATKHELNLQIVINKALLVQTQDYEKEVHRLKFTIQEIARQLWNKIRE